MDVKDIRVLIRKGNSFVDGVATAYEFLPRLAVSSHFTDDDWESWLKASQEAIEGRLRHLDMALKLGLDVPPDQHPVKEQTKRAQRADRIRKQIAALSSSIEELEKDEGFTWSTVIWKFRDEACQAIANKHPATEWRRSLPPMVYLGTGWERGVEASLESLPAMLNALKHAVGAWEGQSAWPVRANQGETQRRTYLVKTLVYAFKDRYGRPLNRVVAALANEFFPGSSLNEKDVSRLAGE